MQTQYHKLSELALAIDDARKARRDMIADTRHLTVMPDASLMVGNGNDGREAFPINGYAHHQIAERVGIPTKYYDRMRSEAPELLADNVNCWFHRKPERRMVRTSNGTVRAFLSDKYQRIDNDHVLGAIYPILNDLEGAGLQYHSLALTDTKMYLKCVLPTVRGEVRKGDIVEAGVEFRNGEIGNSRFEVWPFAYRLICLNGARFEQGGFKKLHVGARADVGEDVYEMLSDQSLRLDDAAFLSKAKDIVKATLTQETFDKLLGKMRDATEEKIEGNPAKAVELLGDSFGLNEQETGSVLRHLIEGGDLSRWGVANAITRTAHDIESYDRADELEGLGGKLIELPTTQWERLALAA